MCINVYTYAHIGDTYMDAHERTHVHTNGDASTHEMTQTHMLGTYVYTQGTDEHYVFIRFW